MIKKQPDDPSVLLEGNDRFEGFAADLADKVADLVGFEYRIELVKDMKYGERMSDGTWNGMVGELTRKVGRTLFILRRHVMVNCAMFILLHRAAVNGEATVIYNF